MIMPFLWLFFSSFKTPEDIATVPIRWLPKLWTTHGYVAIWQRANLLRVFFNSTFVATGVVFFHVLTSSLAGYSFAKFKYPGRNYLFLLILATMMIPYQVTIIPLYVIIAKWLKLSGTYASLILPEIVSAFGIFLMRQNMLSVPDELIDAARIDGSSEMRTFFTIVLPQVKPALASLAILTFLWNWDSLLWPLLCINRQEMWTVPIFLANLGNQYGLIELNLVFAGTMLSVLPVLLVYLFFQRSFVESLAISGIKG